MAHKPDQEPQKMQYPLDSTAYKILDQIGVGVSAIVYKAICIPMNSTVVAIKSIDLDQSRADFDNIRRETKMLSLLSHPNVLGAHCSFTVDRRLWVVMPFMSGGSLQSIISSSFPDGLPEPCIAIVLKETLNAMSYLHNQGHLHRDIKAGNILIDSHGTVKLADFGVSASIYESNTSQGSGSSSSSSRLMLTDVAGTPYWMAPEVIHSHTGYGSKADIWSFGITALELAHGRPPLSHLPLSKSLLMKITKRFRFSDYDKHQKMDKNKKFSKSFQDMVASCLDQDPSKRPSAEKVLKHSFFKNCKGTDFLVKNVLQGLPSVEERFKESKALYGINTTGETDREEEDFEEGSEGQNVKSRRISGWNFNVHGFELYPVFPTESNEESKDDSIIKKVRFGGETIIQDQKEESSTESSPGSQDQAVEVGGDGTEEGVGGDQMMIGDIGDQGVEREVFMEGLMALRSSLDVQRQEVSNLIGLLAGGEMTREEELMQQNEALATELVNEKKKNLELGMELEFLKLLISSASNDQGISAEADI